MQTLKNRLYFRLKPYLPLSLRMGVRHAVAQRTRRRTKDVWPIDPSAAHVPAGWPGWPDGKKFAVVLTHDVEGSAGVAKCRQLAQLEQEVGFRSSFNFIPRGEYQLSDQLHAELVRNGFEIGVHDLFHDGNLYSSLEAFRNHAAAINQYVAKWGAVGYRSGFMLHNYDWHHLLDVLYDASSFDTDPFEPQPDGVRTIFPFWVPRRVNGSAVNGHGATPSNSQREGYVELPYTLPQDSTLFLVLRETTPDIWFQKLEWVAQHGGMALLGVHPDYIQFEGDKPSRHTFPAAFYRKLLQHIRSKYGDTYWQPLPRDVARFVVRHRQQLTRTPAEQPVQ